MSALQKLLEIKETFVIGGIEYTMTDNWPVAWKDELTVGEVREARAELKELLAKIADLEAVMANGEAK